MNDKEKKFYLIDTSSPRYSSPPPLGSQQSDNLLGSPIPDFRSYGHNFQTSSSQLASVSPTAEVCTDQSKFDHDL